MAQITVMPVNHAGTQRHDRLLGGPGTDELVGSSGNDTLADGPGEDRSRGDEAVTTYLDEEPIAEPTIWALWAGLFGIGIALLPELVGSSGNDTLADGPGEDRSRGDEAVTTYLDEEPVAEPTTWALWAGLFGIGIALLPMLFLALWYTVFPLRRNNGTVTSPGKFKGAGGR